MTTMMQENGRTVRRRLWLSVETGANGQDVLYQYTVQDNGNTEVAEQTFTSIRGFAGPMRNMTANMAVFYFKEMITAHNLRIDGTLAKKNLNPSPVHHSLRAVPFGDVDAWQEYQADDLNDAAQLGF